jgi:FAD/FMN-containing dehydrogenase
MAHPRDVPRLAVLILEGENADLFWGLRGGGGNFGVATSFEFQLHPVGPVLAGMVLYPFCKAREALKLYREFAMSR